eukprot:gene929-9837_t
MKQFVRKFTKEIVPIKQEKNKKWDVIKYKKTKKQTKLPKNMKLSPQQLASTSNFSTKDLQRDPIPFYSPKKIEALKRGDILPKEIEDNLIIEKKKQGVDIYPLDDPHWLKITSEIMGPLVVTMDEKRKELLSEDPEISNFFVKHEVNVDGFNLLFKVQAAHGISPDESYEIMKKWDIKPNEESYINLISNSKYEKAIEYFSEMIHKKFSPTIYSYGALIKSMCNSGKTEEASETVEVMRANDLYPNQVIYTTVLAGFIRSGDLTRAWKYYDQLKVLKVKVDQVLYGVMMNAAAEVGEIERASLFLNEMEEVAMIPTEVNFNILIKACSKRKGKFDLAFQFFEKMEMHGYTGDIYTYNALIQVCSKIGNVGKIMELLADMKKKKVIPSKHTFELFIHAIAIRQEKLSFTKKFEKHIEKAKTIFNEMKEQHLEISTSTLNTLLSVLTKSKKTQEAVQFFREEYKNHNLQHDSISYGHLITMYTKENKTYLAKKYFKEMLSKDLKPTYSSIKQISYGFAIEGKTEKAYEWLKESSEKFGFMLNPPDLLGLKARIAGSHKKRVHLRHVERNLSTIAPNM